MHCLIASVGAGVVLTEGAGVAGMSVGVSVVSRLVNSPGLSVLSGSEDANVGAVVGSCGCSRVPRSHLI